jgi:hypothetical protein
MSIQRILGSIEAGTRTLRSALEVLPEGEWSRGTMYEAMRSVGNRPSNTANPFIAAAGASEHLTTWLHLSADSKYASQIGVDAASIQPTLDAAKSAASAIGSNRTGNYRAALENLAEMGERIVAANRST